MHLHMVIWTTPLHEHSAGKDELSVWHIPKKGDTKWGRGDWALLIYGVGTTVQILFRVLMTEIPQIWGIKMSGKFNPNILDENYRRWVEEEQKKIQYHPS